MGNNARMTPEELEALKAYIAEMEALEAQEPEYNFDGESADAWEAWNKKGVELTARNSGLIKKALLFSLGDMEDFDPQSIAEILKAFLPKAGADGEGVQTSLFPEDEEQQRLRDEVLNALPRLQSLIPQKHLIPNNKLANSLTKNIIDAGMIELDVSGRKEPELLTRCILN